MNKRTISPGIGSGMDTGSPRRGWLLLLGVLASTVFYLLIPVAAYGLTGAEPSFLSTAIPGIKAVTYETLKTDRESGDTAKASLQFLLLVVALFGVYFGVLRLTRGRQSTRMNSLVFAAGAGFLLILAVAPVMLSSDVYFYALYGRILSVHGASPYLDAINYPPSDPFGHLLEGQYLPSWYGPLWTLICAGVTRVTGENVGVTILAFRLLAVGAALVTAGLIWLALRRLDPERATQGLVLFLWNPLMILETGLSAHNDVIMLSFVLFAISLHLRGWKAMAVVALTLSALVKFLTGMLIPLYIWLVLRESQSWGARARFLARSGLAAGAIAVMAIFGAGANKESPASQAATATDFYGNNFHELIFKGLRQLLGEDEESLHHDIYFQGWWLVTKTGADLAELPTEASPRRPLAPGSRVFVIARQMTQHARVYDPASRQRGWVDAAHFQGITVPTDLPRDPELERWQAPVMEWPTVKLANRWIRGVTWAGFALFGLLAAWRTTNFQQFLVWSGASLLASYYFIITEIWPWYPIWAVALGALAPGRLPALFAGILSACVLTLHVTIGYEASTADWIYQFRSVPAFVLPFLVFLLLFAHRRFKSHGNARTH